jgi:haloacetate dehalogenase
VARGRAAPEPALHGGSRRPHRLWDEQQAAIQPRSCALFQTLDGARSDRGHARARLRAFSWRAGHRIACPLLALWGAHAKLEAWYDTLAIWREWASDVRGRALPCGHYLAEELPEETTRELLAFFLGTT